MTQDSLIDNLTLFYRTLAALTYIFSPSDILYPPNIINLPAAHEAGLSPEAIDLLQHLPHLSEELSTLPLLPDGTQAVFYTSDDCLDWARRPTYQDDAEIASSAFVLTNSNIYGTSLLYDSASHKLLPWEAWSKHVDFEISKLADPFSLPDAKPADQILGPWIKKLMSLEWVCFDGKIITEPEEEEIMSSLADVDIMVQCQAQFMQWSFRDVYISAGWDATAEKLESARKDFDVVEFARMEEEWRQQMQEVLDVAYEQQWPWHKIRMEVGGELEGNQRAKIFDAWVANGQHQRHIDL